MIDLSPDLYARLAELLEAQRVAVARHAGLLDAQRAALRSDDLELLVDVTGQAAHLLEGLELAGRHLTLASGPLAETTGPLSDAVRATVAALAGELHTAFAGVRQFAEALQERRDRLVRIILDENGMPVGRPGNSFRADPSDSAFLDRSG